MHWIRLRCGDPRRARIRIVNPLEARSRLVSDVSHLPFIHNQAVCRTVHVHRGQRVERATGGRCSRSRYRSSHRDKIRTDDAACTGDGREGGRDYDSSGQTHLGERAPGTRRRRTRIAWFVLLIAQARGRLGPDIATVAREADSTRCVAFRNPTPENPFSSLGNGPGRSHATSTILPRDGVRVGPYSHRRVAAWRRRNAGLARRGPVRGNQDHVRATSPLAPSPNRGVRGDGFTRSRPQERALPVRPGRTR